MAAHLICLTSGGGVPIFTRNKGNLKPLPFPVIGSLNGVHMFANSHDVKLLSTTTEDAKVVWKVFHDSITLIIVTGDDSADDIHLNNLLSQVCDAMVLLYGLEDLANIKNIERFKREIKICSQLIDKILDQADLLTVGDLTNAVDIIAAPENSVLQNYLDAFTEAADSPYGCLMVHGKIAIATKRWWTLTSKEMVLLSLLMSSLSPCSSRDIPVFLPNLSPSVPHRLLTFQLIKDVDVCVLCGPSPTLAQLEEEVGRFWRSGYDLLRSLLQLHPRNYPLSITLDSNIMGFILVNRESHRCLCSTHPHPVASSKDTIDSKRRLEILRSFYKHVMGTFFPMSDDPDKGQEEICHQAQESYISTDSHKCYTILSEPHQIFVLYTANIPTFAMRSVTQKTLSLLVKDKHIQI
ncbi:hypothetical protein CHS0354_031799 [Potamilus streckersoni]|uniref:Fuzzy n=1 Tax=Potamilus streckersoni TaxID=2493646 RepID=A0AAE0VKC8_9BIVA|nr:hypothetical protein CHS0354_031799 [Potamilus streckersoni]